MVLWFVILLNFIVPYFVSDLGELCKLPIDNEMECKHSARYFGAVHAVAEGRGHDLPYGCILQQFELGNSIVYWNKGGVVDGSSDPKIQQLCVYKKKEKWISRPKGE